MTETAVAGYAASMSDNSEDLRHDPDSDEQVQAVLDRVTSYHEGAPAATVRDELAKALHEVDRTMPDAWMDEKSEQISKADPLQA